KRNRPAGHSQQSISATVPRRLPAARFLLRLHWRHSPGSPPDLWLCLLARSSLSPPPTTVTPWPPPRRHTAPRTRSPTTRRGTAGLLASRPRRSRPLPPPPRPRWSRPHRTPAQAAAS